MTTEKPFPIALEQIFFVRSSVIAIQGFQPSDEALVVEPINMIDVTPVASEPNRYSARMSTVVNKDSESNCPYHIDMECIATLITDGTLIGDEALRGVTLTAHSVLYGAIRESMAWMTSHQPYGTFMLGLSVLKTGARPAIN